MSDTQTDGREDIELAQVLGETPPIQDAPKPQQQVALQQPKTPLSTGGRLAPLIPRTLSDVIRLANVIHDSRLAPYGLKDAAMITVAILTGMELGLAPMAALRSIAVINGRPAIWGDAGMAMPRQHGVLEKHSERFTGTPYKDDFTAHCLVKRRGEEPVEQTFSVADAKLARLWEGMNIEDAGKRAKAPWVAYPRRMLMWRARIVFRDAFPDIMLGMRFAEEAQDDQVFEAVAERIAAPVTGSGIAARLNGTNGGGYAGGVEEAIKESGDGKGETKPSAAAAPVAGSTEAKPGGAEPGTRAVGSAAAVAGDASGLGANDPLGAIDEAGKALLDKLFTEFVGAVSKAEVEAVWLAFKEDLDHSSSAVLSKATAKYEAKMKAAKMAGKKK